MSFVTTLMLSCGCSEHDERGASDWPEEDWLSPALKALDEYCRRNPCLRGLPKEIDDISEGYKAFQHHVYGWGANYFDIDGFLGAVAAMPWEDSGTVQVFVKEEEADPDIFTVYRLREDRKWVRSAGEIEVEPEDEDEDDDDDDEDIED